MQQSTVLISGRVSKISCFRYILRWPERRVRRPLTLPFLILRPGLLAEWGAACLETTSCPREGLALMVRARRRPLRTPNFRFPRARRRSIRAMASAQAGRDGRALESRRDHQCLRRGSGGGRGRGDGGGRRWCGGVISELRKAGTEQ